MAAAAEGEGVTRVLVVYDDSNVRFTVRVALEGAPPNGQPMEIMEAAGGNAALTFLQSQKIDVVLLDVMMPDMDGFAVLKKLRTEQQNEVPVVMLTASGRESDVANAFRAGADAYVSKPFDVDELARITQDMADMPLRERRKRRIEEMERAELLLQLEYSFDFDDE